MVRHTLPRIHQYRFTISQPSIRTFRRIPINTPFIEKWNALGGAPGDAMGAVAPITGGSYQNFSNGRLYWNQSLDQVFWVHGAILPKYDSLGREGGVLGLPTSDELAIPGGVNQNYTG